MAEWLKRGTGSSQRSEKSLEVRETVAHILAEITRTGDDAVREFSLRFDNLERESFRLSDVEIQECMSRIPKSSLAEIEFAQTQVRNFAQHQRSTLRDSCRCRGMLCSWRQIPSAGKRAHVHHHGEGGWRETSDNVCSTVRGQASGRNCCRGATHGWC
jgi:histidinol dehydrogenase